MVAEYIDILQGLKVSVCVCVCVRACECACVCVLVCAEQLDMDGSFITIWNTTHNQWFCFKIPVKIFTNLLYCGAMWNSPFELKPWPTFTKVSKFNQWLKSGLWIKISTEWVYHYWTSICIHNEACSICAYFSPDYI